MTHTVIREYIAKTLRIAHHKKHAAPRKKKKLQRGLWKTFTATRDQHVTSTWHRWAVVCSVSGWETGDKTWNWHHNKTVHFVGKKKFCKYYIKYKNKMKIVTEKVKRIYRSNLKKNRLIFLSRWCNVIYSFPCFVLMGQIIDSFVSNIWVQWNDLKHTECMLNSRETSQTFRVCFLYYKLSSVLVLRLAVRSDKPTHKPVVLDIGGRRDG